MKKRKWTKRVVLIVVCLITVLGMTVTVFGATRSYTAKYDLCTRCSAGNWSYGYNENQRWQRDNKDAGHYCPACGQVVAAGKIHSYLARQDRYYYLCAGAQCSGLSYPQRVYWYDYDNGTYSDHSVYDAK